MSRPLFVIGIVLAVAFVVFGLTVLISWITISHQTFPKKVLPGETYQVGGQTFRVPDKPHKTYKTKEKASKTKPVPVLSEKDLLELQELMRDGFELLHQSNVPFWVTGGTLLGAVVWGHMMCYDDDIDVAVPWEAREYIWSSKFAALLSRKNLEVFNLRGSSLKAATKEGGAVRVRRKGTSFPIMDIFFVKERRDGSFCKVNGWYKDKIYYEEPKEKWDSKDWIFPLQYKTIQGVRWPLPNQPEKCLQRQYGDDFNRVLESPEPMTKSHKFVFLFTNAVFSWRVKDFGEHNSTPVEQLLYQPSKQIK